MRENFRILVDYCVSNSQLSTIYVLGARDLRDDNFANILSQIWRFKYNKVSNLLNTSFGFTIANIRTTQEKFCDDMKLH